MSFVQSYNDLEGAEDSSAAGKSIRGNEAEPAGSRLETNAVRRHLELDVQAVQKRFSSRFRASYSPSGAAQASHSIITAAAAVLM